MKSVVIACKAVTEDVEDYEHEAAEDDSFSELKQELSSGLTQLMTAAKLHSNNFNEDEEEFDRTLGDMETAADQLEAIVMDIVNVARHGGNHKGNGPKDNGHNAMDRDHHSENQQGSHVSDNKHPGGSGNDHNEGPMDAQDLKVLSGSGADVLTLACLRVVPFKLTISPFCPMFL